MDEIKKIKNVFVWINLYWMEMLIFMKIKIKLTNGLMKLKNLLEINIIILYMSIDYTPNNTFIFYFVRMNPKLTSLEQCDY